MSNLIREFNAGKESAFKEVFQTYYPYLLLFVTKMNGNKTEAEDIVLVTFQSLFVKHLEFDSLSKIKAFLFITARNNCVNSLVTNKRKGTKYKIWLDGIDDEKAMELEGIKTELLGLIHDEIENLPLECKRVFKMLIYDELKPVEIGVILGITTQTVYVQKNRAIKALRIKLINKP